MSMKSWQVAAGAALATLGVAKALGFVSPGERLARAETPGVQVAGMSTDREIRDEVRGLASKTTTLEANYTNLDKKLDLLSVRVDTKLDRLIDMQIRAGSGRRPGP